MKRSVHVGDFRSMPARVSGELSERVEDGERALKYHHAFIDDYTRGLSPNDLVLVGDQTGIGKTDLVMNIATTNASQGRRVHIFALEAEPRELERRTKFAMLSNFAHGNGHPHPDVRRLNYADWRLGRCEDICEPYNAMVEKIIAKQLSTLFTFYRDQVFTVEHLRRQVLDVAELTDLFVIDHLHYIDIDSDEAETRAIGDLVKTVRDITQNVGKPAILVAHLRKREQGIGAKRLVPTLDDFHGSSNITKICTHAVIIERCHVVEPGDWYVAPTFFSVLKDRRSGPCPFVAVSNYDRRKKSYESTYTLGRLEKGGTEWTALPQLAAPPWAAHHRELEQP